MQKNIKKFNQIWICDKCHNEVASPKKLTQLLSIKIEEELGFIVKRIICPDCEQTGK